MNLSNVQTQEIEILRQTERVGFNWTSGNATYIRPVKDT